MNRYPQCHKCQLNQDGICKHDGKPIAQDAQIFGMCKHVKWIKPNTKQTAGSK